MKNTEFESIFISYRREDTGAKSDNKVAENIFLHLKLAFGDKAVFMDTRQIAPGDKWEDRIEQGLRHSAITIALIGPKFFDEEDGKMRLEDPADWVRRELEFSISSGRPVIPLLIDRPTALRSSDFDKIPSLLPLTRFQHYHIDSEDVQKSAHQLIFRDLPGKGIPLTGRNTPEWQAVDRNVVRQSPELRFGERLFFNWLKPARQQDLALKALHLYNDVERETLLAGFRRWLPLRYAANHNDGPTSDFLSGMFRELVSDSEQKFFLLLGESGGGKSTALARLFTELVLTKHRFKAVFLQIHLKPIWSVADLPDKGKTILLIDGMDEAAEAREDVARFFQQMENLAQHFAKVVVGCRTQFFAFEQEARSQTATRPPFRYRKLYLQPLGPDMVQRQIAKDFSPGSDEYRLATQIVTQSDRLFDRPMLLPFVKDMAKHRSEFVFFDPGADSAGAGVTAYEAYSIVIRKWIERESSRNAGFPGDYGNALMLVTRQTALFFFRREQQKKAASIYYADLRYLPELQGLPLTELHLRSDSLLHRNDADCYRFAHRTFKEYFYAVLLFDGLIAEAEFPFAKFPDAARFYQEMCEVEYFRIKGSKHRGRRSPAPKLPEYSPCRAFDTFARLEGISLDLPVYEIFMNFLRTVPKEVTDALTACACWMLKNNEDAIPESRTHAMAERYGLELTDLSATSFFYHRKREKTLNFLHRSFAEFLFLRDMLPDENPEDLEMTVGKLRFPDLFADELAWLRFWQLPDEDIQLLVDNHSASVEDFQKQQERRGGTYTWPDYMNDSVRITRRDYEAYWERLAESGKWFTDEDTSDAPRVSLKIFCRQIATLTFLPGADVIRHLDLAHNHFQGALNLISFVRLESLVISGNPDIDIDHSLLPPGLRTIQDTAAGTRRSIPGRVSPVLPPFSAAARFQEPEMIQVQGGVFRMGSEPDDPDALHHEMPAHKVRVSDFSIGRFPVTVQEFASFVQVSGYVTTAEQEGSSWAAIWSVNKLISFLKPGCDWRHDIYGAPLDGSAARYPVVHLSWHDAVAYCAWLSAQTGKTYRLPTEAEWEYAAIGGHRAAARDADGCALRQYVYAGSDELNEVGWYEGKFNKVQRKVVGIQEVRLLQPNELGLYDMSGLVWEWCADWYDPAYYLECSTNEVTDNPECAAVGTARVLRGGSWNRAARDCRTAYRFGYAPRYRDYDAGFRLVSVP